MKKEQGASNTAANSCGFALVHERLRLLHKTKHHLFARLEN